ncbi:MAG: hypothetical protein ACOCV1_01665 [Bacillota bacterium]
MLNETIIESGNMGEILIEAHQSIAIPEVLTIYIAMSLIFLIAGLIMIDTKKSGYSKFLQIYFISQAFIIILFLIPILFLPTQFHELINKIIGIFS